MILDMEDYFIRTVIVKRELKTCVFGKIRERTSPGPSIIFVRLRTCLNNR